MCGIAGILHLRTSQPEVEAMQRMTSAMAHRGPDAVGTFTDGPLTLGHLRLSILDLSSAANQPFTDNSGRYVIVFNGEVYNYNEVKDRLKDYSFRTTSDTEMLVAAYAKWGVDCLDHFRGMYAFAIWDKQERELFIVRDRLGVKPVYYYMDDTRLIFASELRAILATGWVERRADPAAMADFFSYQSVSFPHSMIMGIKQMEAGSWMKIKDGKVKQQIYWDVTKKHVDFDFSDETGVRKRVRDLMLQSVERRLVSDVPVGAFLSGGIDSSAVVGLMAEAGHAAPNTFNICFEEEEFDESPYAEMVARKFNTNHTKILLKPTVFLDELRNGLDALDIPSGDGINTYVVSKAIRQNGMTVALSGAGGDELFAGYPFFMQYLQLKRMGSLWKLPSGARNMFAGALAGGQSYGRKARMGQMLRLPDNGIDKMYPVFRQIITPQLLEQLTSLKTNDTAVGRLLSEKREALSQLPLLSQVSAAEYLGYTQHTLLKDTDQMSMAVSLEVREPYFDQDLVEFVMAIPDDIKRPTYPKSLLVESLEPLLPDEIVHRKKKGFLFPWELWLRNELRSFGEEHIRRMAQREFVQPDRLMEHWRRFVAGDKNIRWMELWLFIVLDYWMEKNGVEC